MMKILHVIDANCSWIQSLVDSMPGTWRVRRYRIYSPQWLPGGPKDIVKALRVRKLSQRIDEVFCIVPGWNKHPQMSARLLQLRLCRSLARAPEESVILLTFPFYSGVAAWVRGRFPAVKVVYHAHDPFEFYTYPQDYIRKHEDRLVPLCHSVLAISEKLADDFRKRYPNARVSRLGNATSTAFLEPDRRAMPDALTAIRAAGRPVVGCIGQVNSSYDWDLLESAAAANPSTQFVFVGNLFEEGEVTQRIRTFFERRNVHWLGPQAHADLPAFMSGFDICLNPLAVSPHNDRRDTLRLYDYLTTARPVYSTAIDGARTHGEHVQVFDKQQDMVRAVGSIPVELTFERLAERRRYVARNTWEARSLEFEGILNS